LVGALVQLVGPKPGSICQALFGSKPRAEHADRHLFVDAGIMIARSHMTTTSR
jgi:hypothetical protein